MEKPWYSPIKWLWFMLLATFALKSIEYRGESIDGFAWRKIAGLFCLITAMRVTALHVSQGNYEWTLTSWEISTAVCIGLITIPELLKAITLIKSGKETNLPSA